MPNYDAIYENIDLNSFYVPHKSLRQQRLNNEKLLGISNALPMINYILSTYRVNLAESEFDETSFIADGYSHEMLKTCKQRIYKLINYSGAVSTLSLNECLNLLNRANIHLPFSSSRCQNALFLKFSSQQIGGKVVFQYNELKYVYKITAIAIHEDRFRLKFDQNLNILDNVINEVLLNVHDNSNVSDRVLYDLSTLIHGSDNFIFSNDRTVDGTHIDHTIDGTNDITSVDYTYSSTGVRELSHVYDYGKFLSDLTNAFVDNTVILILNNQFYNYDATTLDSTLDSTDTTVILNTSSVLDSSVSILKERLKFDETNRYDAVIVPFWTRVFMPNEVSRFFKSRIHGYNEYIGCDDSNSVIPYGDYLYSILRMHYGFDDTFIVKIFRLILAQRQKNNYTNSIEEHVQVIMNKLTGIDLNSTYFDNINLIEDDIISSLSDMTGLSNWVIYSDNSIDITTNIKLNYIITLSDIYDLIRSLDKVKFLYIVDFGYDDNLINTPLCFIWSKDRKQQDIGYLEIFSATTELV